MTYKIALLGTEEGYSVSVPGLPGCWSQGATEEEALLNIRDAIQGYLAARDALIRTVEAVVDASGKKLLSQPSSRTHLLIHPFTETHAEPSSGDFPTPSISAPSATRSSCSQ
jgi:predicted RNase H-like HicB family nuclease